jgi:hypothetical protein
MQGRGAEVIDLLVQGQADAPTVAGYRLALAMFSADLGRMDEARELLAPELAAGFAQLWRDNNWFTSMHFCAETVVILGLVEAARALYDLLEPYADQLPNSDLLSYDIMHLDLANLAVVFGDYERAEPHFTAALETHERIGAKHSLAKTQADWARMLVARGGDGDRLRARELAERALASAEEHGYGRVARHASAILEA